MNRREFTRKSAWLGAGLTASTFISCKRKGVYNKMFFAGN